MVLNILYFPNFWDDKQNLTNIFQTVWNHQPASNTEWGENLKLICYLRWPSPVVVVSRLWPPCWAAKPLWRRQRPWPTWPKTSRTRWLCHRKNSFFGSTRFLNNKSTNIFYFENCLNKKRETQPHFLFWDLFEANHFGPISWIDTRCQDGSWSWFWPHVSFVQQLSPYKTRFVLFWSSPGDDLSFQSHSRATCHGPQQQYWQQGSCGQGDVLLVVACLRGSSYCSSRTRRWFCNVLYSWWVMLFCYKNKSS